MFELNVIKVLDFVSFSDLCYIINASTLIKFISFSIFWGLFLFCFKLVICFYCLEYVDMILILFLHIFTSHSIKCIFGV